ncbi:hypothetical protein OH77DRAFT_832484 [Trametes cingulata]|nr:hypothetical protein OH77DRAFT_832484 [Trametes cingulata]
MPRPLNEGHGVQYICAPGACDPELAFIPRALRAYGTTVVRRPSTKRGTGPLSDLQSWGERRNLLDGAITALARGSIPRVGMSESPYARRRRTSSPTVHYYYNTLLRDLYKQQRAQFGPTTKTLSRSARQPLGSRKRIAVASDPTSSYTPRVRSRRGIGSLTARLE